MVNWERSLAPKGTPRPSVATARTATDNLFPDGGHRYPFEAIPPSHPRTSFGHNATQSVSSRGRRGGPPIRAPPHGTPPGHPFLLRRTETDGRGGPPTEQGLKRTTPPPTPDILGYSATQGILHEVGGGTAAQAPPRGIVGQTDTCCKCRYAPACSPRGGVAPLENLTPPPPTPDPLGTAT